MREIGDIVRAYESSRGECFALATLVRSRGSSYRRPGARMLISSRFRVGSLSGGCLEDEVVERAGEVLRTGVPAWIEFDTRRRFGCHGVIEVFIECAPTQFLAELADNFHARRSASVATVFARGTAAVGSRFIREGDEVPKESLVQQVDPPVQLIVVGEGTDNTALCAFAETLGWSIIAVESTSELRGSYDEWTAAVVKTHNYGRDFAALRALLPLGLRYVGLMGPRKRRDQLLGDLHDTGFGTGADLFAPAGMDLGGDSPESIALAIVAEIQTVFAGGSRQSLRDRKTPIHASFVAAP